MSDVGNIGPNSPAALLVTAGAVLPAPPRSAHCLGAPVDLRGVQDGALPAAGTEFNAVSTSQWPQNITFENFYRKPGILLNRSHH